MSTRAARLASCLWPGLARLWLRAEWSGLATAAAFAGLLNGWLWATFAQPPLVGTRLASLGWLLLAACWSVGVWRGCRVVVAVEESDEDLFLRAQTEYLRGHWLEAETLLEKLLESAPGDAAARLLLSSVYRRTRRADGARRQLKMLERSDAGRRWQLEIRREYELLDAEPAEPAEGASDEGAVREANAPDPRRQAA